MIAGETAHGNRQSAIIKTTWTTTIALCAWLGANVAVALTPTTVEKATFAGGCFWCMEAPFEKLEGVLAVTSGYTGGTKEDPTYEEVSEGITGHAEAVEILYDPNRIAYEKLLEVFWHNIDPTTKDRQFCDTGHQYRTGIFFHSETQRQKAEASKKRLEDSQQLKRPIVTEIEAASKFYPAEEYHQGYYKKNPVRYKVYRYNCGRDARLQELWGTREP